MYLVRQSLCVCRTPRPTPSQNTPSICPRCRSPVRSKPATTHLYRSCQYTSSPDGPVDFFGPKEPFFSSIPLDCPTIHQVHSLSLPSIPKSALGTLQAPLRSFLEAALTNLDLDSPVTAIYATPRLLLAPPDNSTKRRELTRVLRARCDSLQRGESATLWQAYDWISAQTAKLSLPTTSAQRLSAALNGASAKSQSPSGVFRCASEPPYLPPTDHSHDLLRTLFPQGSNPHLNPNEPDSITAAASTLLPKAPLGSGFITDPAQRKKIVAEWSKHLDTHPFGAPDGTGLRSYVLTMSTSIFHLTAQWMHAILTCRTTPAHRRLLATKTLRGKMKPDKRTGELPKLASQVTAARPLGCHPGTRRLVAGFMALRLTVACSSVYIKIKQFGLIKAGLETGARQHQLHVDFGAPALAHAGLDITNAHTSASRQFIFLVILGQWLLRRGSLDQLLLFYVLAYYSAATTTLIQNGQRFFGYLQTDGLDQGEALASHAFGVTLGILIWNHLLPSVPSLIYTLIHDDTTFADLPLIIHLLAPSLPLSISAEYTPLPFAIHLYRLILAKHMLCELAGHKSIVFQPPLPPDHPLCILRLTAIFPTSCKMTQEGFLLAGVPVALPSTFAVFLTRALHKYSLLIESLLVIPSLSMQLRFLILTVSCRPTSTYAHFLRSQPPSITSCMCDVSDLFPGSVPLPFVDALYRLIISAFARIIRVPSVALTNAQVARGTSFQLSLRTKEGGISLPDPAINLSNPSSWSASCSTTLSDAHFHFHVIAPLLPRQSASPIEGTVATLLMDPTGQPSITLLHNVAQKHAQCAFSSAIFTQRLSRAFDPPFFTTEITRARLRHSAVPGAQRIKARPKTSL